MHTATVKNLYYIYIYVHDEWRMHVLKSENLPFLWSLVVSFLLCEAFVLGVFLESDFAAFCCLTSNVTTSTSVCLRFLRALFLEVVCFFFRVAFVLILFLAFCFGFCFPAFCRLALTTLSSFVGCLRFRPGMVCLKPEVP